MGAGTNQKAVNSTTKADPRTEVAQLKVKIQQQQEAIKRLHAANRERLRLYLRVDKKIDVLHQVRLTTTEVALLLNIGRRRVRNLYKEGKIKGFQWSDQGQIQFSLPDILSYMNNKRGKHIGKNSEAIDKNQRSQIFSTK